MAGFLVPDLEHLPKAAFPDHVHILVVALALLLQARGLDVLVHPT